MGWDLREKIKEIPDQPGVYLFKDAAGKIIYIGKAKSLKKRLASYLSPAVGAKTGLMLSRAQDLELRLTSSESLALFLEAGLIRQFHPKYNVSRRDDKNFPLVKITHEEFPAVSVVRRRENDGSRYFGPYTSAKLLREALRTIRRSFPFRVHQELPEETRLYHKMGLSPASTLKEIDRREYSRNIRSLSLILNGRTEALVKKLTREMKMAAKARDFERAAVIRDQISALAALTSPRRGFTVNDEAEDLKNLLNLPRPAERVEAFDISNLAGTEAAGSMVSFFKGKPDKNNYRRFRIKTIEGIDDYRMLAEVVNRRYCRLLKENRKMPDLILVDGGRGHLLTALNVLNKLGVSIPLISIAKQEENLYTKDHELPIRLKANRPAANLLLRVRDEAHRFALGYHRLLRRRKFLREGRQ